MIKRPIYILSYHRKIDGFPHLLTQMWGATNHLGLTACRKMALQVFRVIFLFVLLDYNKETPRFNDYWGLSFGRWATVGDYFTTIDRWSQGWQSKDPKVNYLNTYYTMSGTFLASKLLLHFENPHFLTSLSCSFCLLQPQV